MDIVLVSHKFVMLHLWQFSQLYSIIKGRLPHGQNLVTLRFGTNKPYLTHIMSVEWPQLTVILDLL